MLTPPPTTDSPQDVVVIGAGIGGMAAAVRLAAAGHRVTLCERGASLGGRAREFRQGPYRWDAGPTVLTGLYLFEELFAAAGRSFSDEVTLHPVTPFYRVFGADGQRLDYVGDEDELVRGCLAIDPDSEAGVRRLVGRTRAQFRAFHPYTERHMMQPAAMLGMLPFMLRHRAFGSIRAMVRRSVRHPFLRAALEFHPILVGGDPGRTPALYALITEFERRYGVHYAVGGTSAVVDAMARLLGDLGVDVRLECEVARVERSGGRVTGVRTAAGDVIPATVVVSNADPLPTRAMAGRLGLDRLRSRWQRPSMSLHVLYLGTHRRWSDTDLTHHSLLLPATPSAGLDRVFRTRARGPVSAADRFLYVHLPSRTDPHAAPADGDALYVLVAVPPLRAGQPAEDAAHVRRDVLARLEPHLPGISSSIVAEHHIGPEYFRDELGSPAGAAFGLQPTLLQSAWFRAHNRQRRPRGLYLVGAGTHPGAGVPAVLASARIAADLIQRDVAGKGWQR